MAPSPWEQLDTPLLYAVPFFALFIAVEVAALRYADRDDDRPRRGYSAVDSRTSIEIMGIFQKLNIENGITILLITHESDIAEYAGRIVSFRDGRIVRDQPVATRRNAEVELAALGSPAPVAFVPHLLPLDQGELATCFATTTEPIAKDAVQALYRERYRGEPFVRVLDRPPDLRSLGDTNECHVYVTVEERGRLLAFSAIDNIWKGASGQGVQNLNLMLGLEETEGLR